MALRVEESLRHHAFDLANTGNDDTAMAKLVEQHPASSAPLVVVRATGRSESCKAARTEWVRVEKPNTSRNVPSCS